MSASTRPSSSRPAGAPRQASPSRVPSAGDPAQAPGAAAGPVQADGFDALGLPPRLLEAVRKQGFARPTPVQTQAIPVALAGRDLLGSAATGSGKTAAFLLPIMARLMGAPRRGTRALVLTPTRELAAQILDHFRLFSAGTGLRAAAVFGGVSMGPQERAFREGVDVLVATPGRLLDHLQYPYARLDGITHLVLDEADRMLDMGFLPDVKKILKQTPGERQTLFFSATLPPPIVNLASGMLREPVSVSVETGPAAPAKGITHRTYPVASELKSRFLVRLLEKEMPGRALAFTRTRHRANRLADFLEKQGVPCDRLHGSRSQAQRTSALNSFRQGRIQVLVATDIAARGIDVPELDLVVNFDVPAAFEDYIHRVGRTARAEATGLACTLVAQEEEGDMKAIERATGKRLNRETLAGFDYEQKVQGRFEVPLAERIAAIRARKAEDRARSAAKAERRAQQERPRGNAPAATPARPGRGPVFERGGAPSAAGSARNGGQRQFRENGFPHPPAGKGGNGPHRGDGRGRATDHAQTQARVYAPGPVRGGYGAFDAPARGFQREQRPEERQPEGSRYSNRTTPAARERNRG